MFVKGEPLHICIVTFRLYPPVKRGLEIHVKGLVDSLIKQGHSVTIITSVADDVVSSNKNIVLHRVSPKNFTSSNFNYLLFLSSSLIKIFSVNKHKKIDVIHLHGPPSFKLFGEILQKIFVSSKVVYTIHGQGNDSIINRLCFSLFSKISIIAVSSSVRDFAVKFGILPSKIVVIPSGINLPTIDHNKTRIRRNILFVGGLYREKGIEYLILAYNELIDVVTDNLLIVGEGDQKLYLQNLVSKLNLQSRVFFCGSLPHEKVIDIMQRSLFLVAPSVNYKSSIEGTPIVLLEAMSVGLPIISTKVGGIPEVIKDDINGLLVDATDSEALRKAILRVYFDDGFRAKISSNNIVESTKYSWDEILVKINELYISKY